MSRTLMMMSGVAARVPMLRFPFACAAMAAAACACTFVVPWDGVWGFMAAGPLGADGLPAGLACLAAWAWVTLNTIAALFGLGLTLNGQIKLSEYPIWWGAFTVDEKQERHIEVWKVLVWLPFVPAELAGLALLSVYGLIGLLRYPWRLLATAGAFDLARLWKRG